VYWPTDTLILAERLLTTTRGQLAS
jgi:hypothetical protein